MFVLTDPDGEGDGDGEEEKSSPKLDGFHVSQASKYEQDFHIALFEDKWIEMVYDNVEQLNQMFTEVSM